jgi:hypothetical protein
MGIISGKATHIHIQTGRGRKEKKIMMHIREAGSPSAFPFCILPTALVPNLVMSRYFDWLISQKTFSSQSLKHLRLDFFLLICKTTKFVRYMVVFDKRIGKELYN